MASFRLILCVFFIAILNFHASAGARQCYQCINCNDVTDLEPAICPPRPIVTPPPEENITEEDTVEVSETEENTTEEETVEVSETEENTTEEETVEVSETEENTTEEETVEVSETEENTTEEETVEVSETEENTTEEETVEVSETEENTTEEETVEVSETEENTTEEETVEVSETEENTTEEDTVDVSEAEENTTEEETVEVPGTDTTEENTTEEETVEVPGTDTTEDNTTEEETVEVPGTDTTEEETVEVPGTDTTEEETVEVPETEQSTEEELNGNPGAGRIGPNGETAENPAKESGSLNPSASRYRASPHVLLRTLKQMRNDDDDASCIVTVSENPETGESQTDRGCVYINEDEVQDDEARCMEFIGEGFELQDCHICDRDGCNSAGKAAGAVLLLAITLAINQLL